MAGRLPDELVDELPATGSGGVDAEQLRHTMSHFAAGVVVVTARFAGVDHAMTATAFCSVSLDPPLVLVSVGHVSRFHRAISGSDSWAVSVLGADQLAVAQHFSFSGRDLSTQFDQIPHRPAPVSGAPLISGSLAWLDCRTETMHEAGDHTLVVGLVLATGTRTPEGDGSVPGPDRPLTHYLSRYHS